VPCSGTFTILHHTIISLLGPADALVPDLITGTVSAIDQYADESQMLLIVDPRGVQGPDIQGQFRGVANTENIICCLENNWASAVMFDRILGRAGTSEKANILGSPSTLESAFCGPPVPDSVEDS
jgi:hypothetical protein